MKKGFTLIELMISISIIVILFAATSVSFTYFNKQQQINYLKNLGTPLEEYVIAQYTGEIITSFPDNINSLNIFRENPPYFSIAGNKINAFTSYGVEIEIAIIPVLTLSITHGYGGYTFTAEPYSLYP